MRLSWTSYCLPLLAFQAAALPRETSNTQHVLGGDGTSPIQNSPPVRVPHPQGSNSQQPTTGFVALGDSYSAGIGTGADGDEENECRQGRSAYPRLIHADLSAAGPNATQPLLQWLSCTGAATADLLRRGGGGGEAGQIDAFEPPPRAPVDFATLSVGGNDLGFFDVINACVFRFYAFRSGPCGAALARADALVRGPGFAERLAAVLREVLDKVQWEKRPAFAVTVTGYARFFDAETPLCDDRSLAVWWGGRPRLTADVRRAMNRLVLAANDRLRAVVAKANRGFARPRVWFADVDGAFEGHRFCEAGVEEPDYGRAETWFFLVGGPDNNAPRENGTRRPGPGPDGTGTGKVLSPLSALVDPATCLPRARESGDWGELALCHMAMARRDDPSLVPAYDGVMAARNSMWYVPTYYGKTFHPRTLGHEAIRDRIYEVWRENGVVVL